MYTKVTVNIDKDLIAKRTPQADHALAALAAKDTEPFVPMLNGVLLKGTKYSLQGTTQGRYLTGGETPIRFSM